MNYRKFNDKVNIMSELIIKHRKKLKYSYSDLSNKLQLLGVTLYKSDLYLIENDRRLIRDFELVALCQVLEIDYSDLEKTLIS